MLCCAPWCEAWRVGMLVGSARPWCTATLVCGARSVSVLRQAPVVGDRGPDHSGVVSPSPMAGHSDGDRTLAALARSCVTHMHSTCLGCQHEWSHSNRLLVGGARLNNLLVIRNTYHKDCFHTWIAALPNVRSPREGLKLSCTLHPIKVS